jgi:hypothetical protein
MVSFLRTHIHRQEFQLHICAFILAWKKDWTSTLDALDKMVSVKVKASPFLTDSRNIYFKKLAWTNDLHGQGLEK